jgi:hypothetical protein
MPPPGHHAKAVTFKLSLCYYERKYKDKRKMMAHGLGKSALWMKVPHTLYKGTHA